MYLLDTNTLSELIKRRPNGGLIRRLADAPEDRLFTASVCVMELWYGVRLLSNHQGLWKRIEQEILSRVRVLGLHAREALVAAELLVHLKRIGRPVGLEDVLIGAIARAHGQIVVTHNVKHFEVLPDVKVEDWFVL